jgi:CBS domain containing-hemolysin-like protein
VTIASNARVIRVADVMTPWNELSLVSYDSLQTFTAADVYQMFQGTGLTHLLVIENNGDDSVVARGLLSRVTLAKRLRRIRGA